MTMYLQNTAGLVNIAKRAARRTPPNYATTAVLFIKLARALACVLARTISEHQQDQPAPKHIAQHCRTLVDVADALACELVVEVLDDSTVDQLLKAARDARSIVSNFLDDLEHTTENTAGAALASLAPSPSTLNVGSSILLARFDRAESRISRPAPRSRVGCASCLVGRACSCHAVRSEVLEQERLVPNLDGEFAGLVELRAGGDPHHDDAGVL